MLRGLITVAAMLALGSCAVVPYGPSPGVSVGVGVYAPPPIVYGYPRPYAYPRPYGYYAPGYAPRGYYRPYRW